MVEGRWVTASGTLGADTASIERIAWQPSFARYDELTIDLSRVTFIRPAGVVSALALVQKAGTAGLVCTLLLPHDSSVCGYLAEVRFLDALDAIANVVARDETLARIRPSGLTTLVRVQNFGDSGEVEGIANQIVDVFQTPRFGLSGALLETCHTVVVELANNVIEHAESSGWILAQQYRFPQGAAIEIAVVDMGVGIRASLRRNSSVYKGVRDDADALKLAISEGVSRVRDPHRGYGLDHIRGQIDGYPERRLVLASGRGRLTMYDDGSVRAWTRRVRLPGVLAYAWVPC